MVDSDPGADPLVGTVFDGTYEILARIGKGGMGSVYRAYHRHLERDVAIKVLRGHGMHSPHAVQRFRREARALNLLSHPNIVGCYAFGIHDQYCYLSMDLIHGTTLADEVVAHGSLSDERFRKIFSQVLSALQHAHDQGVVHRDLKPDNIMLIEEAGDTDIVKLVDFGIAKLDESAAGGQQLTQTGAFIGSPLYMSPEQCCGRTLDPRSDLYSLACLMYFSLTGNPPFQNDNALEIINQQVHGEPPPLPLTVSAPIANLIQDGLAKLPEDRFQTAEEMSRALQASQSSKETRRLPGRRKTSSTTFGSPVARHPRRVAAAALTVTVGAIAVFFAAQHLLAPESYNRSARKDLERLKKALVLVAEKKRKAQRCDGVVQEAHTILQSLLRARIKLATVFLERNEPEAAASVAQQIATDIKEFVDVAKEWPILDESTISGIAQLGTSLPLQYKHQAGLFLVLAASSCQMKIVARQTTPPEKRHLLEMLDHILVDLKQYESAVQKIALHGIPAGHEINSQLSGYSFATPIAASLNDPAFTRHLVEQTLKARMPLGTSGDQDAHHMQAAHALKAAAKMVEAKQFDAALAFYQRALERSHFGQSDANACAPAAGYHAAFLMQQKNPKDSRIAPLLKQSVVHAEQQERSTVGLHLLAADHYLLNKNRAEARKQMELALQCRKDLIKPDNLLGYEYPDAYYKLAELDLAEGQKGAAVKHLKQYVTQAKDVDIEGSAIYYATSLVKAADAANRGSMLSEARAYYEAAYELCVSDKLYAHAAGSAARLALVESTLKNAPAAMRWADSAVAVSQNLPLPERAYAYFAKSQCAWRDQKYAQSITAGEIAAPLFERAETPELKLQAQNYSTMGASANRLGDLKKAEGWLRICLNICGTKPGLNDERTSAASELYAILQHTDRMAESKQLALEYKLKQP